MKNLVSISNLSVNRGSSFKLNIPALGVQSGSILCITGPNGSGKTTLINCLVGLLKPDAGTITVDGVLVSNNLRSTKALLGFVPDDEDWLIKELCAKEYFSLLSRVYREAGVRTDIAARIDALSAMLHFASFMQPLESLSHGNKKKVQLIAGLMHTPKVIILDEVRNGLDPLAIIATEQLLMQEAKRGACIIATTHDLSWAERTAEDILLLRDGSIEVHEKTAAITKRYGSLQNLFLQSLGGLQP